MINEIQHCFSCICCLCMFYSENVYLVPLSILKPSYFFDSLNALSIWSISHLRDQWFADIFFHSTLLLFTVLIVSFADHSFSGYCNPICLVCLFMFNDNFQIKTAYTVQGCNIISQRDTFTGVFKDFFSYNTHL